MNPTAAGLLGADPADCVDKTFAELNAPPELARRLEAAFDTVDAGDGPVRFRFDATVGGEAKSYTVAVTEVEPRDPWDARRDARRFCYAVEDLTAFGKSERDRALMRAAVEHADAPTVIFTPDLDPPGPRFLYANPAAVALTGYGTDTLFERLITTLDGAPTDPSFPARFRQALKERGSFRGDSVIVHADGSAVTVEWSVSAVRDDDGAPTCFVATLQDVADRRELERQVLEAQTREQARIARDLHDGVAQQLAGLNMLCGSLKQQAAAGEDPTETADAISEAVRDAARDLRSVAHGLMPLDPGRGGLTDGLRRLAKHTSEIAGTDCRFEQPGGELAVADPDVAHHLYRIAQEAVGNAVRHGNAKTVVLTLDDDGVDRSFLAVADDGDGFDAGAAEADPEGGMGLTSMRYRAKAIGGRLAVEPAADGGTRVVCTFPHAHRDDMPDDDARRRARRRGRMTPALLLLAATAAGSPPVPVPIIFDTDMDTDCDDVGALAVLHALADLGECEILATPVSSRYAYAAPCTAAINRYYGRGGLPVGAPKGDGAGVDRTFRYAKPIAVRFPTRFETNADAPDAVAVYPPRPRRPPGRRRRPRRRGRGRDGRLFDEPPRFIGQRPGRPQPADRPGTGETEGAALGLHGRPLPGTPRPRRVRQFQAGPRLRRRRRPRLARPGRLQRPGRKRAHGRDPADDAGGQPRAGRLQTLSRRPPGPTELGPDRGPLRRPPGRPVLGRADRGVQRDFPERHERLAGRPGRPPPPVIAVRRRGGAGRGAGRIERIDDEAAPGAPEPRPLGVRERVERPIRTATVREPALSTCDRTEPTP